jgi:integrase/recombinase XerD
MPRTFTQSVALADWPADLQEAWASACRPGTLLRQREPATTWSGPTKVHVVGGVGNLLFWLRQTDQTMPGKPFVDLVTPERVQAYVTARRSEIRDISVRSRLVGLARGMAVLFPNRDWSWIRRIISNIPDGRAESRRRKQPRIRHSLELFDLGVQVTHEAEKEATLRPIDRAVKFRDGVIIALLALRPIRRKNATALAIGVHVIRTSNGWRLFLPAAEVKNRQEYDTDIPAEVGTLLDHYLDVYRPILLAAGAHTGQPLVSPFLWVSNTGRPLIPNNLSKQVSARTAKAFGKSVPPHFFRDSAMTTWAMDLPTQVRGGIHVLGNRSFAVAEGAYNMAGSSNAASKLQRALSTLRRSAKGHTHPPEKKP